MNVKVRRQEKLDMVEKKDFRREEIFGKYIAKILYRQNNSKFEKEYLKKVGEKLVKIEVSFSRGEILKRE